MGDDDALSMNNWGYYEPFKATSHLGLQLNPAMTTDHRNTKSFFPGRDPNAMMSSNGVFQPRDFSITESTIPVNYNNWINQQRDKMFNVVPLNPTPAYMLPETSRAHSMHNMQPQPIIEERGLTRFVDEDDQEVADSKKRQGKGGGGGPKAPRPKKPRKPKEPKNSTSVPRLKGPTNLDINGIKMDISGIPIPVCSCTGAPQQCYRWGTGGWQSACCTTNISTYPLPMSTKRRGARIAGRKMSVGAFTKVLEKLAGEGYNFSKPIDLKTHWARHGTNKFVTIK